MKPKTSPHRRTGQQARAIARTKKRARATSDLAEIDRQIEVLTEGLRPYIRSAFKAMAAASPSNAQVLCRYIIAEQTEINIKDTTKEWKTKILIWLSQHFEHRKEYSELGKEDILLYLNSLRKPVSEDPDQRWIGTYNNRILAFSKFFRWLYNPDEPDFRKRNVPECMKGVKRLPTKKKSSYKPSDMWTSTEHSIFLKYCPSARDRCYHAMAKDTSARPHELLGLKIKDIHFRISPDSLVLSVSRKLRV